MRIQLNTLGCEVRYGVTLSREILEVPASMIDEINPQKARPLPPLFHTKHPAREVNTNEKRIAETR